MAIWLKRGASAETKADSDRTVRDIVETILADIAARGDAAVRTWRHRFAWRGRGGHGRGH